jgi:hypothetical protein
METNLANDNLRILDLVKLSRTDLTQTNFSSSTNLQASNEGSNLQTVGAATAAGSASAAGGPATVSSPTSPISQTPVTKLSGLGGTNFSSPASLLTTAGSTAAVLSVTGLNTSNLLITSTGALGMAQMASYNPLLAGSSSANNPTGLHQANTLTGKLEQNPGGIGQPWQVMDVIIYVK